MSTLLIALTLVLVSAGSFGLFLSMENDRRAQEWWGKKGIAQPK